MNKARLAISRANAKVGDKGIQRYRYAPMRRSEKAMCIMDNLRVGKDVFSHLAEALMTEDDHIQVAERIRDNAANLVANLKSLRSARIIE